MGYEIKLDAFEGPLELLLHLIEQARVDIYDIPIAEITAQYLHHLEEMQRFDVAVASEFLVMAATLLYIKSKMLLPRPVSASAAEEEEPADPRQELVAQLLEYKKYKAAAAYLQALWEQRSTVAARPPAAVVTPPAALTGLKFDALLQAFAKVWQQARESTKVIDAEKITVGDKMAQIMDLLAARPGGVVFTQTMRPGASREEVVVTFLAVLELLRQRRIAVVQEGLFAPIHLILPP